jgi:hypothetical protein
VTSGLDPTACGARQLAPSEFSAGYLELPYTLPQDSTLFLMLREKSCDIWQRKLGWIAKQGGMALVNVHPDYIEFGDPAGSQRYPVRLFVDLLRTVRSYGRAVWEAIPREVAAWCMKRPPSKGRTTLGSSEPLLIPA